MNIHSIRTLFAVVSPNIHRVMTLVLLLTVTPASGQVGAEPKLPSVRCVAFSPDGALLAAVGSVGTSSGQLVVWDTENFQTRWTYEEPAGFPRLAFSPDGRQLALSRFAPEMKLLNVETGEVTGELVGHAGHARCVAYTPDGQRIITGSHDTTLMIWNTETLEPVRQLPGANGPIYHVAVSPNGSQFASAEYREQKATLWDLAGGTKSHEFADFRSEVLHVSFSPDGRRLAISSRMWETRIVDADSYETLGRVEFNGGVRWTEYSPDGRWLVMVTHGNRLHLLRAESRSTPEIRARVTRLLDRFNDDSYEVRELAAQELVQIGLAAEPQLIEALDSPLAETRIRAKTIRQQLYDVELAVPFLGHSDQVECATFSPDGKWLASGDSSGVIIVWRVEDGQPVRTLSLQPK